MRWFLTDDHPLASALSSAGEAVVSGPSVWTAEYLRPPISSSSYPLAGLALGAGADVAVLVDPIREFPAGDGRVEFGFARGYAKTLRNRKVALVMLANDNPETLNRYLTKAYRSCTCNHQDAAVWVVPSSEVGDLIRGMRRVVVWNEGQAAEGLLEACSEVRAGKVYRASRDGRRWG